MIRHILATTALVGALAVPQVADAQWRGEVYGGAVLDRSEEYGGVSQDMDTGVAYGLGVYNTAIGPPNFELGLDLMGTNTDYSGLPSSVDSVSLMVVGRVSTPLATGATLYGGLGVGAIRVDYDGGPAAPATSGHDTVAGAQVEFGVRYNVGAGTIFGAIKHQEAFEDATIQGVSQSFGATSVIAGWRFSF